MVWDKLRDGVPTKYAYSKARHYLPPPIRVGIKDICKYMLLQYDNSIIRGETVIRTSEKHKCVLEQLKKDVSLSTRVEAREGIWDDIAFVGYVAYQIRLAHRELQDGISPEEAENWRNLEVLQPSWVLKSAQDPDVEYLPESVIVNALDPLLLPALTDTPPYVPERMDFLQQKQAEFEPVSNSENRLGPRSKTGPEGTTEPFDVGDGRGISLSTRAFSMIETEEETLGVEQTVSASGICDRCGVYHNDLPTHASQCYGRCLECNKDAQACIRGAEDPIQCIPCLAKGSKCSGVSQESNADPDETKAICPRCWVSFVLSNMANHVSSCKGRCGSCIKADLPCVRLPHDKQQCYNC
ncbi:hypothetical protein FCULG_00004151 [Fusarium culmorum]|uniref:Uncharacterized protein n=1 Tax=Fusarium culmorum TaxID=5516 RepID=A0A2T4H885_FUSCU|nr:hypothetical protein FCULG_00004151 [Fusarium culmorum]